MNILITLICHFEQKPFYTNEYEYLLDCVEHSREAFNDKPKSIDSIQVFNQQHEKLEQTNNDRFSDSSNQTLKLGEKTDLKRSVDTFIDAHKTNDTKSATRDTNSQVSNYNGIQFKEDTIPRTADKENNAATNTKTSENNIILKVNEAAAAETSNPTPSVPETTEDTALNDGIPEDVIKIPEDGIPEDVTKIPEGNNNLQTSSDVSPEFTTSTTPVPEDRTSATPDPEETPSTISPSNTNQGSSHQVSPNRQHILAAEFVEKLESSFSNEVDYICVNATCDANNTMDPLARLILVHNVTSIGVDEIRIRNINLEAPYDVGYLECELEVGISIG